MTSWAKVRPQAPAWDLRATYDAAWDKFKDSIADMVIEPVDIMEYTNQFDLVISTIPLWAICMKPKEHRFNSVSIIVKKSIDEGMAGIPMYEDNWVIYNGSKGYDWYRASSIFGHRSVEARALPPLVNMPGWESGFKVVNNNCDCHPNIARAGRMGLWTGGVLTHHAFEKTIEAISEQFGVIGSQ